MEASFGADLLSVRVHESHAATHLNARAYSDGNDIFFGPGLYQPHTDVGLRLASHEVAHLVQQDQGSRSNDAVREAVPTTRLATSSSRQAENRNSAEPNEEVAAEFFI